MGTYGWARAGRLLGEQRAEKALPEPPRKWRGCDLPAHDLDTKLAVLSALVASTSR